MESEICFPVSRKRNVRLYLKLKKKNNKDDDASRGFLLVTAVLVSAVLLVAQAKGVSEVEAQETFFSLSDDALRHIFSSCQTWHQPQCTSLFRNLKSMKQRMCLHFFYLPHLGAAAADLGQRHGQRSIPFSRA